MKLKKDKLDDLLHRHMDLSTVTPRELSEASAKRILSAIVNEAAEPEVSSVNGQTGSRRWKSLLAAAVAVAVLVFVVFMRMPAIRNIQQLGAGLHAVVESADGGL